MGITSDVWSTREGKCDQFLLQLGHSSKPCRLLRLSWIMHQITTRSSLALHNAVMLNQSLSPPRMQECDACHIRYIWLHSRYLPCFWIINTVLIAIFSCLLRSALSRAKTYKTTSTHIRTISVHRMPKLMMKLWHEKMERIWKMMRWLQSLRFSRYVVTAIYIFLKDLSYLVA